MVLKSKVRISSILFRFVVIMLTVAVAFLTIGLIGYLLKKGLPYVNRAFLFTEPDILMDSYGIKPMLINTIYTVVLTLIFCIPLGIGSAIYLAEYARKSSFFVKIINVANETLSGIPSIVYGLFGFLAFVISKKWGYSLLACVITLAIMVLPLIIRTSQEAILGVDNSFREASYGLGAGKLRTVFKIVLPSAMPGILSGIILAIGRIVGETAALIYTAGTVPEVATSLTSSSRTISVHLYCLLNEGLYTEQAYATAVVLIIFVVIINALSNFLAKKIIK